MLNRRIKILIYWIFQSSNNVSFYEIVRFLLKPKVRKIAEVLIEDIFEEDNYYRVLFNNMPLSLYWPKIFPVKDLYQVIAETFDQRDWHYYQKEPTKLEKDEVLVDIGAAEGLFSLSVIDKCKKVIIIEPNTIFYKSLKKTFKQFEDKVQIYNVGIGKVTGKYALKNNSFITTILNKPGETYVCTLDELLYGKSNVTYIKADMEGHEFHMLKGAINIIKKYKPKIAITSYHKSNNHNEIISFVKSIVPEYNYYFKGIYHQHNKPIMIHFWK